MAFERGARLSDALSAPHGRAGGARRKHQWDSF